MEKSDKEEIQKMPPQFFINMWSKKKYILLLNVDLKTPSRLQRILKNLI